MSNTIGPDELFKLVSNKLRFVIRDRLVRNTMETECSPYGFHSLRSSSMCPQFVNFWPFGIGINQQ